MNNYKNFRDYAKRSNHKDEERSKDNFQKWKDFRAWVTSMQEMITLS